MSGASAVVLFYQALAIGTMGVVAPLAALGVVVPVVIGIFSGSLPSIVCCAGIVVAIGGVVAVAGPGGGHGRAGGHSRSMLLAIGAALGFGLLQYAISGGSRYSTVMTMLAMRCASLPVLAVVCYFSLRPTPGTSPARRGVVANLTPRTLLVIGAVGVFDVGANLLFAIASVSGALAVVAVLGSLYPAATVLLARIIDHEQLTRLQNIGVVVAVVGVAMIAAGS